MIIRLSNLTSPVSYDIDNMQIVEGELSMRLRNRRGSGQAFVTLTLEEAEKITSLARKRRGR